jgi:Ser/Thr protein kinase RdoA (MazF antagonist)
VTHNDAKFNNVLLNQLNKGCCVIDLDTVMPGIVHYDFGDGIRSTACTAAEDESDLQWVSLDRNRFFAFKEGYLEGAKDELDATEIQFLPLSGAYMAFIMGLRFLTDYMEGNTYYKIDHPNHNLDRCKNQFKLSQDILHQLNDLK